MGYIGPNPDIPNGVTQLHGGPSATFVLLRPRRLFPRYAELGRAGAAASQCSPDFGVLPGEGAEKCDLLTDSGKWRAVTYYFAYE